MAKPRAKKYSARTILSALIKADMNEAEAARALGCARQTVAARIRDNPKLRARVEEFNSLMGQYALGNVGAAIQAGDVSTSRWYLERTDERFRPTQNNRLDDEQLAAIIAAMPVEALRKLAGGA